MNTVHDVLTQYRRLEGQKAHLVARIKRMLDDGLYWEVDGYLEELKVAHRKQNELLMTKIEVQK